MLRDLPPYLQDADDHSLLMTGAPGTEHGHEHESEEGTRVDSLDDVFGSAPASPALSGQGAREGDRSGRALNDDYSDIPRLRSLHVTNGYREGIAVSKERHMQEGFDEGYTLGAELGLKAGWCLGALEGIWHALPESREHSQDRADEDVEHLSRKDVRCMLDEAQEELKMQSLLGREYFGEDGIWLYNVPGQENDGEETTFEKVAEAHPVLHKWTEKVLAILGKLGLHAQ